jgi:hypothetical protein
MIEKIKNPLKLKEVEINQPRLYPQIPIFRAKQILYLPHKEVIKLISEIDQNDVLKLKQNSTDSDSSIVQARALKNGYRPHGMKDRNLLDGLTPAQLAQKPLCIKIILNEDKFKQSEIHKVTDYLKSLNYKQLIQSQYPYADLSDLKISLTVKFKQCCISGNCLGCPTTLTKAKLDSSYLKYKKFN